MKKDARIPAVKSMVMSGGITQFSQIFHLYPKTNAAKFLGWNNTRFSAMLEDLDKLPLREMHELADLFDIDYLEFYKLIYNQRKALKPVKKKS